MRATAVLLGESRPDGGLYRYEDEGLFKGFTTGLLVDTDGLVLGYPNIFKSAPLD